MGFLSFLFTICIVSQAAQMLQIHHLVAAFVSRLRLVVVVPEYELIDDPKWEGFAVTGLS